MSLQAHRAQATGLPDEGRAFLDANPDIETVQLVITDANGIGRGKNIAREELAALYATGRNVAGSILGLDATGEDVDATGLVWDVGDADQCCRPVAGTLRRAPWHGRPTAQVLGTMYELDGSPARADPRHVLARVVERCRVAGYLPVIAVELEFYLLERGLDGRLAPSGGLVSGERRTRIDSYGLGRLDDMAPLFDDFYAAARQQGLPVRTLMSEYAPGQFEITLEHRADALRAVDDAIQFKRAVRGCAARHGRVACFMAKPFAHLAGSGMHLHASLADPGTGANVFADDDPAGSPLLRRGIGGLRTTLADGMAVYAPNANSYRRFRALSYAPVAATWGVNNRSVSLRVPAGPAETRHVEHRVAGADANPYLAAAAMLAGMHHGIVNRIDPGPPIEGNGYAQAPASLPGNWYAAMDRMEASSFLKDYLGARFMEIYCAIKRAEQDRFYSQVTELDFEWYLRTA